MADKKVVIQDTVFQNSGGLRIGPNAAIEIRDADSDALVSLWEDREAASGESNPFSADGNGQFTVYADPGRVKITVTISGDTRDWVDVWLLDVEADGTLNIDQIDEHTSGGGVKIDGVAEIGNAVRLDRDKNCLLHMPLKNSLAMPLGVGSATFARSTIGTYIDRYGVMQIAAIDGPRFELEDLLMEGESTNELLNSEDFNSWSKINSAITTGATAGPDGVGASADHFHDSGAGAGDVNHLLSGVFQNITGDNDPATCSVFAKGAELDWFRINVVRKDGTSVNVYFDATNGVVGTEDSGIVGTIQVLADNWFRYSVLVADMLTGGTTPSCRLYLAQSDGGQSYVGDGASGIYIFGGQGENFAFATSYIPTVGSAVTRTADNLNVTIEGNIPLQADAWTIIADADILGFVDSGVQVICQVDGEIDRGFATYSKALDIALVFLGSVVTSLGVKPTPGIINHYALAHEGEGNGSGWFDGSRKTVITGADISDALGTSIAIGYNGVGAHLFGHISNFRIYDRALNDGEMGVA